MLVTLHIKNYESTNSLILLNELDRFNIIHVLIVAENPLIELHDITARPWKNWIGVQIFAIYSTLFIHSLWQDTQKNVWKNCYNVLFLFHKLQ